ncbi:VaFE repeat-containing surface-anchored protein [Schaalia sp. lx-100]|uniref:VaFE repeat-containing surface-anchored protein n=1 Tax=Schaalia sp. lx-100 TaxID=2899081 RepID=UPI001E51B636|nr:VaFE repeat-containing surface-anchored protein [Schaalia sp. lx-100]MCD4557521.1 VaFE repeat-containing surface-anchored protein [Schaalia sp. lx-100]
MSTTRVFCARRSRLRSILAALVASVVVGGTLFAVSTLTPPASQAAEMGPGYEIKGAGGLTVGWLAAITPPAGTDQKYPAWCIQLGVPAPDSSTPVTTIATLADSHMGGPDQFDVTTAQMAYLLDKYQMIEEADTRAALAFLIHMNFEVNAVNTVPVALKLLYERTQEQQPQVLTLAEKFAREARASAAVSYQNGEVEGDGHREGTIKNISVMNNDGSYVAGIPVTLRLTGPAVFKENGTDTWSGVTTSEPLTAEWVATGNGLVTAEYHYTRARRTLTKYGIDGKVQDTLSYGNPGSADPEEETVSGPSWRVIFDFQPRAVSDVAGSKVVDGVSVSDTVTVSADTAYGSGEWMVLDGEPVPVVFEGSAYLVGQTLPERGASVPEGARPVATASFTATGPGTYSARASVSEDVFGGFVTWVWRVVKNNQTHTVTAGGKTYPVSLLVHADWADDYGIDTETASVRYPLSVDTAISQKITKSGTYLVDDVFVSGLPDNHPDFAGGAGFQADTKQLDQELLFFPKGLDVVEANRSKAELIGKVSIPAKNGYYPSVGSTVFKTKSGNPQGTYVFVTSFAGDDRVKALSTSVEDTSEQYTVQAPDVPVLHTSATDGADGDKELSPTGPVIINDQVCYENLATGKEYVLTGTLMDKSTEQAITNEDGQILSATRAFTPYESSGCETVTFTVDGGLLAGRTTVVFERATHQGRTITVHTDINDQDQTITTPNPPTPPQPPTPPAEPTPPTPPTEPPPRSLMPQPLARTGSNTIGFLRMSTLLLCAGCCFILLHARKDLQA